MPTLLAKKVSGDLSEFWIHITSWSESNKDRDIGNNTNVTDASSRRASERQAAIFKSRDSGARMDFADLPEIKILIFLCMIDYASFMLTIWRKR